MWLWTLGIWRRVARRVGGSVRGNRSILRSLECLNSLFRYTCVFFFAISLKLSKCLFLTHSLPRRF